MTIKHNQEYGIGRSFLVITGIQWTGLQAWCPRCTQFKPHKAPSCKDAADSSPWERVQNICPLLSSLRLPEVAQALREAAVLVDLQRQVVKVLLPAGHCAAGVQGGHICWNFCPSLQ